MKYSPQIYVCLFLSIFTLRGNSQDKVGLYPVRFAQYYTSQSLENPAFAGTYSDIELNFGNQRMLGNLSKISSYYALANYRLNLRNRSGGPNSVLGINLYDDQEGKYLTRTRFYLVYAWHANISRQTRISGGLSLGAMNYSVKGTPLSGDGSDINPDAAVGFQIYRKDAYLGISVNQLFNSEVQPLKEITILSPYLNICAGLKFTLSEEVYLKPSTSMRFPLAGTSQMKYRNLYSANLQLNLYKRFEPGIGIYNNEKLVISLAVADLIPAYGMLDLHLSYSFLILHNSNLSTPFIEMGIAYRYDRGSIR